MLNKISSRDEFKNYFKSIKRSVNKARQDLSNLSNADRKTLWKLVEVEYDEFDAAKSIEQMLINLKKGFPKDGLIKKEEKMSIKTKEEKIQETFIAKTIKDAPFKINKEWSELFPSMGTSTKEAVKKSIIENGMRMPIIVSESNEIIDGHHRYSIWKELIKDGIDIELKYQIKNFKDNDEIRKFIVDTNQHRRHLAKQESAIEAAKEYIEKREKISFRKLAEKYNVSIAMIHAATHILKSENEEFIEAANTGQVHISKLSKTLKEHKESQEKAKESSLENEEDMPQQSKTAQNASQQASVEPAKLPSPKTKKSVFIVEVKDRFQQILMEKYSINDVEDLGAAIDIYEEAFITWLNENN